MTACALNCLFFSFLFFPLWSVGPGFTEALTDSALLPRVFPMTIKQGIPYHHSTLCRPKHPGNLTALMMHRTDTHRYVRNLHVHSLQYDLLSTRKAFHVEDQAYITGTTPVQKEADSRPSDTPRPEKTPKTCVVTTERCETEEMR
ncbi:hypothetical protein LZ30DRAFT_683138 [Colletotrichum cereale]|nr:hypothetical protein LZ30DRAFT_683138 [Colletotrichum cereale]